MPLCVGSCPRLQRLAAIWWAKTTVWTKPGIKVTRIRIFPTAVTRSVPSYLLHERLVIYYGNQC
ncbi:hypothetical protein M378DRAFT_18542 [Amanita muscaria Koide BX008]|uniref:Uncharacterized protein n=1 Tax=Amanita muscaria (strain Koide BX008) TaxID=946122 RepID=A0A0C2WDW7_AMAMK|nr:hypothetical protein M378DRAFT_18542 [Amanita muscaria Koide BX008]